MGFLATGLLWLTTCVIPSHEIRMTSMIAQAHLSGHESVLEGLPVGLYLPPNPAAPGQEQARLLQFPYLLAQRTTNYYHASVSQGKNIELVAQRLNNITVQPGETFSYYHYVGPYTAANGYGWGRAFDGNQIVPSMGGGVCQGASTLYSALLRTGLPIVERHPHGLTVPYLPAGEDATVAASAHMDFQFKNNMTTPILITSAVYPHDRFLSIALWGKRPVPNIQVHHQLLTEYPFQTIVHHEKGSSGYTSNRELEKGQKGGKVQTWLEVKTNHGWERRDLGIDTYLPSSRVIE